MYEKNNNGYSNPVNHTTETDEKERIRLYKNNLQRTVWASFFGAVSALSITLSVYFGMMYKDTRQAQLTSEDYYKQQSINACRRSMFNISDGLQNTDANIGKLLVSSDKTFIVKTLTETEGIAQSSVADLSYLPIDAGVSVSTAKYFNQLGDYCNALSKRSLPVFIPQRSDASVRALIVSVINISTAGMAARVVESAVLQRPKSFE